MLQTAADLLQRCCRPAAERLQTYCCPAAEELQNHLQMLHAKFGVSQSILSFRVLQTCCSATAEMLQTCCCLVAEELQNTQRCDIPNLKSVGQVLHVLACCRTSAGLLQRCCRTAADLLQIMKAHCLEMLHAKSEVSRSHRLGARGDYPKLALCSWT